MRYLPQPRVNPGVRGVRVVLGTVALPSVEPSKPEPVDTSTPGVFHYPEARIDRPGLVVVVPTGGGGSGRAKLREMVIPALVSGVTTFLTMAAFSVLSGWWERNRNKLGLPEVKPPGSPPK